MNQHIQTQIIEELKNIRLAIVSLRADMQVQTTDNSKGQIFSAVPTSIIEQWFPILEKKVSQALERVWKEAEQTGYQKALDVAHHQLWKSKNRDELIKNLEEGLESLKQTT